MKKLISVCLTLMLLLSVFSVTVYGLADNQVDNATQQLNALQYWAFKQKYKKNAKSRDESVHDLLLQFGFSEAEISLLSAEQRDTIYNGRNISLMKSYLCMNEETGETFSSTKAQYDAATNVTENNHEKYQTRSNNWGEIFLLIIQNRDNLEKFLYYSIFSWKYPPIRRGTDFFALFSTEGNISPGTALGCLAYTKNYTKDGSAQQICEEYDYSSTKCTSAARAVSFTLTLPEDLMPSALNGLTNGYWCSQIISMICVDGKVNRGTHFNVSAFYFHQYIYPVVTPSIDLESGKSGHSVSPKIAYNNLSANVDFDS